MVGKRWVGGVLAWIGLALVVPSIARATYVVDMATVNSRSQTLFEHFSWGRQVVSSPGRPSLVVLEHWAGLAWVVVVCVIALVGAIVWFRHTSTLGGALAIVSVAFLCSREIGLVVERLGVIGQYGSLTLPDNSASAVITTWAGWAETASVLVLAVALAFMVLHLRAGPGDQAPGATQDVRADQGAFDPA